MKGLAIYYAMGRCWVLPLWNDHKCLEIEGPPSCNLLHGMSLIVTCSFNIDNVLLHYKVVLMFIRCGAMYPVIT